INAIKPSINAIKPSINAIKPSINAIKTSVYTIKSFVCFGLVIYYLGVIADHNIPQIFYAYLWLDFCFHGIPLPFIPLWGIPPHTLSVNNLLFIEHPMLNLTTSGISGVEGV
ncbi:MAG: hypothetical protein OYH77_00500, partial [Pseudomonadota bacterium]|nr:hypothetical protein [Pseudomonadota bacterium]